MIDDTRIDVALSYFNYNYNVEYALSPKKHVDICKKKPVECPNSCGKVIVKEEVQCLAVRGHTCVC